MSKLLRLSSVFIRDKLFGKYLLVTNTVSGGVMMMTGDYIQQKIELYKGQSSQYDKERAKNMFILGSVFAPVCHFIYKYMERFLPGADKTTVFKKLAVDQTTTAPISIGIFFLGMNLLEGNQLSQAWTELKQKFITVYAVDCLIFIPCQTINFLYLPARYRVLYINCLLIVYDTFLSYIKYKDKEKSITEEKKLE